MLSAIVTELASLEERASAARRMRAARDALISAEWNEDPDALAPDQYLTLAASPQEIGRVYRKNGARFEVDAEGVLTLRMSLTAGGNSLQPTSSHS